MRPTKSVSLVVAVGWKERAEAWLANKQELVFDESGWTPFKSVLVALALPWKNPKRYLEKESDSLQSLWTFGRKQRKAGTDYKRGYKKCGGNEHFYVRRNFVKEILVSRCRQKLEVGRILHESLF